MPVDPISSFTSAAGSSPDPREQASPVTATVAGKTYVANVNYSAGEYVAQDPAVFGAEGTGPNLQAAEEAFTERIDFLA